MDLTNFSIAVPEALQISSFSSFLPGKPMAIENALLKRVMESSKTLSETLSR
jgi:hypothetical protein